MLHADIDLARRLEASVVADMRRFVETAAALYPDNGATLLEVGGGAAAFVGDGSPVNQAWGLGLRGRVDGLELDALERFYASRGDRGLIGVCPLASAAFVEDLAERGWTALDFENVLVLPLGERSESDGAAEGVEIRRVNGDDELELWTHAVANGFSAPEDPRPAEMQLARVAAGRSDAEHYLAFIDGRPAGTGELIVADGLGWLTADTTLPEFRRRGVQASMQRARLRRATELGCDLAVTEARPGSGSQRNMERLGFRVAYTRVNLRGPALAG